MRQIDSLSVMLRLWPEVCRVMLFQLLQRDEKPQYLTKGALHLFSTTTETTEKKIYKCFLSSLSPSDKSHSRDFHHLNAFVADLLIKDYYNAYTLLLQAMASCFRVKSDV